MLYNDVIKVYTLFLQLQTLFFFAKQGAKWLF